MAKLNDASKFFGEIKTFEDAQFWGNHTPFFIRVMFSGLELYADIVEAEDWKESNGYTFYPMQGYFEKMLNIFKESGHLTVQELDMIMGAGCVYSALEKFLKDFVFDTGNQHSANEMELKYTKLQEERGKLLERLGKLYKSDFGD